MNKKLVILIAVAFVSVIVIGFLVVPAVLQAHHTNTGYSVQFLNNGIPVGDIVKSKDLPQSFLPLSFLVDNITVTGVRITWEWAADAEGESPFVDTYLFYFDDPADKTMVPFYQCELSGYQMYDIEFGYQVLTDQYADEQILTVYMDIHYYLYASGQELDFVQDGCHVTVTYDSGVGGGFTSHGIVIHPNPW